MNANGRRCRQLKNGNRHVARMGRSIYRATASDSVGAAIERERVKAQRMQAAKGKKKK